jgi:hypothetical protein
VRAEEKLTAFLELELAIRAAERPRTREQAIDYAQGRACFRSGEIRILDSTGTVTRIIPFDETDRRL